MTKKQIISYIVAIAFLAVGFMVKKKLSIKNKKQPTPIEKTISGVFVNEVVNEVTPILIKSTGILTARNRVNIFSEVQGIFDYSARLYKPGVAYKEGDILLQINSDEFRANLQIQKSNLYQRLVSVLPDLKLDYPAQFGKWESYITSFDISKSVKDLPKFDNQQEKLFITGRGIPTAFYTVKNQEQRLRKYTIYAPYYGILTTTNIDKGSLISPGQRLGTFISPSIFELEVAMGQSASKFVKVGSKINLRSLEGDKRWTGKVSRINPTIDATTQSMTFYVQVTGKDLKDGMYLEADIESKNEKLVYKVNRSLLFDEDKIYSVIEDSILHTEQVTVVHLSDKVAYVGGLPNGTKVLSQTLPGAYDGKIVKIVKH